MTFAWKTAALAAALGAALVLAAGCGPRTMRARMEAGERRGDRASTLMDEAQRALDAGTPDRALGPLREAKEQLSDRDVDTNPESEMLRSRLAQLEARVPEVRAQLARDELAKQVAERKQVIEASLSRLRAAVAKLKAGVTDRPLMRAARDGIQAVQADIAWKKELQTRDPAFGEYVQSLGVELESTERKIELAEKAATFMEGPGHALEGAAALADKASAEAGLAERLKLENDALAQYRACVDTAQQQLAADPGLERIQVKLGEEFISPPDVQKKCEAGATAQQKLAAATQKKFDREEKRRALAEAKAKKAAAAKEKKAKKSTASATQ